MVTCADPTAGEYVSAVCESGNYSSGRWNTTISSCGAVPAGQYVTGLCVSGNYSTVGDNASVSLDDNRNKGTNKQVLIFLSFIFCAFLKKCAEYKR